MRVALDQDRVTASTSCTPRCRPSVGRRSSVESTAAASSVAWPFSPFSPSASASAAELCFSSAGAPRKARKMDDTAMLNLFT